MSLREDVRNNSDRHTHTHTRKEKRGAIELPQARESAAGCHSQRLPLPLDNSGDGDALRASAKVENEPHRNAQRPIAASCGARTLRIPRYTMKPVPCLYCAHTTARAQLLLKSRGEAKRRGISASQPLTLSNAQIQSVSALCFLALSFPHTLTHTHCFSHPLSHPLMLPQPLTPSHTLPSFRLLSSCCLGQRPPLLHSHSPPPPHHAT